MEPSLHLAWMQSSIATAVQIAHPALIPDGELLDAFERLGYRAAATSAREVADGKRLISTRFHKRD